MSMDRHVKRGHPIIFGLLILFGIIELSLSAWLTARFDKNHDYSSISERDRVRFVLFTSTWTVVFSIFYMLLFIHSATGSVLTSIMSHAIFLLFTWVMWTAGAAAVTEMLGGGLNCSNNDEFVYCNQLNALEAFAWVEWILTTFALVFILVRGIQAARRGDGIGGGLVSV